MSAQPARRAKAPGPVRFDEAYYQRYYLDPRTRIYDRGRHALLVQGVVSLAEWFGLDVRSVLDVGAGVGWWGAWLKAHRPRVRVVSTEVEASVCRAYGHLRADISRWRLDERFDLVVCQGVLPYLTDAQATRAIGNLAAMCGGLLYLEAVTRADSRSAVDTSVTDLRVHLRTGAWYRAALAPHFREVGAGLFAARGAGLIFYELEARGR